MHGPNGPTSFPWARGGTRSPSHRFANQRHKIDSSSRARYAIAVPVIESSYRPPWFLRNGHAQTVLPVLFRRLPAFRYERERLELPDGDFLDLDWLRQGSQRAVLLAHGLEGSSDGTYVR